MKQRKQMQKLTACLLAGVLALGIAGCQGGSAKEETSKKTAQRVLEKETDKEGKQAKTKKTEQMKKKAEKKGTRRTEKKTEKQAKKKTTAKETTATAKEKEFVIVEEAAEKTGAKQVETAPATQGKQAKKQVATMKAATPSATPTNSRSSYGLSFYEHNFDGANETGTATSATPATEPVHVHSFQPVYKTVVVKEAWTEEIPNYEAVECVIFPHTGKVVYTGEELDEYAEYLRANGIETQYRSHVEYRPVTEYIEHPAETEQVIDYYQCACGETKQP